MTLADLRSFIDSPPDRDVYIPMTEEEFVTTVSVGELKAEWANGEAIIMAPDNTDHADMKAWLGSILRVYVRARGLGQVFIDNVEARLPTRSYRVPDILFVATDRLKLVERTFLKGQPDLAIEIVSPSSVSRDYSEKFAEYQEAGVREYWIIDRRYERIDAYALSGGKYRRVEPVDGRVTSAVVPGFFVKPEWLWRSPLPVELEVMSELGLLR